MLKRVQPVLAYAVAHLDEDLSLERLAEQAGLSPFHLHRVFSAGAGGETPKQFTLRLRLSRAAAMLLGTGDSVLDIALECGFQSHEAFCRAFRKSFQMTPSAYRTRGFAGGDKRAAKRHAEIAENTGPCIRLFRAQLDKGPKKNHMAYSITKREIMAQPVLVVKRRINPSAVAATLADALGKIFQYAQQNGIALAGQPFTRYLEWGPGLWTIEAGMPVTAKVGQTSDREVRGDELPGGLVATTIHSGTYDKLNEAHAAVQQWIEAQGLKPAGAPWEVYTTDPADFPDPKDWKTEIFWPMTA